MDPRPEILIEFLNVYPKDIADLALESRIRLHEIAGPASDLFFDATSAVCSGLSYTGDPKHNFINIAVFPKYVTLIFPWGVNLSDPEARLKGEGKQVRNIRLSGVGTLHDPYIVGLVEQAAANAVRPSEPIEPRTYVKVYQGPKRRPGL